MRRYDLSTPGSIVEKCWALPEGPLRVGPYHSVYLVCIDKLHVGPLHINTASYMLIPLSVHRYQMFISVGIYAYMP